MRYIVTVSFALIISPLMSVYESVFVKSNQIKCKRYIKGNVRNCTLLLLSWYFFEGQGLNEGSYRLWKTILACLKRPSKGWSSVALSIVYNSVTCFVDVSFVLARGRVNWCVTEKFNFLEKLLYKIDFFSIFLISVSSSLYLRPWDLELRVRSWAKVDLAAIVFAWWTCSRCSV